MNTKFSVLILMLYASAYALLFGTWATLVTTHATGAEQLIGYIQNTLAGLTGHVLTMITPRRSETGPSNPQAGFASPFLLLSIATIAVIFLSGCGAINAYTGASLNAGEANYVGARQNVKSADDMRMILWADAACALPLGALARNATGNPYAVNAALVACPIPNVGIVQAKDGQVQVQISPPTPTAPYVPPVANPTAPALKLVAPMTPMTLTPPPASAK